jgi:hypothetical protein
VWGYGLGPTSPGQDLAMGCLEHHDEPLASTESRDLETVILTYYKNLALFPILFFYWRVPQQMLRTHRSLEAYCANMWWRWLLFFFAFPCNGAPIEWNWQGKTKVLGEKQFPVPPCPQQIPNGLTRDRTRAFAVMLHDYNWHSTVVSQ